MIPPIELFVPGKAQPAGSKKAFALKKGGVFTGKTVVTDDAKHSRPWKTQISEAARNTYLAAPLRGPLKLSLTFIMARPKHHYGTGKNGATVKASAPSVHTSKPDTTKLIRAVEDALNGIVWIDDSQISTQHARKRYGDRPGVHIRISEEENQ